MPYGSKDVPSGTEKVPAHGQAIYRAAFNSAYKQYSGNEERAHATAWAAVKEKYKKEGDKWVAKDAEASMKLTDREFSAKQRKSAEAKGQAMPGGGYPIENKGDLENAIRAFGRAKNKAATKAWIKKRARALGATELLPENWDSAEHLYFTQREMNKIKPLWDSVDDGMKCETCMGTGIDEDGDECPDCENGYTADWGPAAWEASAAARGGRGKGEPLGHVHSRIGAYKIVEGAGKHGGSWFAIGRGETVRYNSRTDAENHAHASQRDAAVNDMDTCDHSFLQLNDTFVLDAVRKTPGGHLAADARVARTGIQKYRGRELGRPDLEWVRVYRPPAEVFHADAMHSMAHRPVTLKHPPEMVDARNWKKYAVGHTGDEVVRDGDFVRVPMVVMDHAAVKAYEEDGIDQLSMGYSCDLKWRPGVTDTGEEYDAVQTAIKANHLAIVPVARGGSRLRIGDDRNKGDRTMNVLIDGVPIEFADELAAKHVQAHITKLHGAAADLQGKLDKAEADKEEAEEEKTRGAKDAKAALDAKDGELAVLKKQLEDAKALSSPEAITKAALKTSELIKQASPLLDSTFVFDGKSDADIRRAAVTKHVGDAAAKEMNDDAIAGAFRMLVSTVKPGSNGVKRMADSLSMSLPLNEGGKTPQQVRDEAYSSHVKQLSEAWRLPSAAAGK